MTADTHKKIVDLVEGAEEFPTPGEMDGFPPPESPEPSSAEGSDFPPSDGGESPPPGGNIDPKVLEYCAGLDQNDTDNGKRLLAHFGSEALYVREVGWHTWTGTHWEYEGGQESVERLAQDTARRIKLEANFIAATPSDNAAIEKARGLAHRPIKELTETERAELEAGQSAAEKLAKRKGDRRKFAVSSGNRARTVAMIAQASPHRTVPPAKLDSQHMLFNVQNGTLRFKQFMEQDLECPDPDVIRLKPAASVELISHERDHHIAKLAPWVYDPAADCPKLKTFLMRFQPNPETRRFLQIAAGRALIGGASSQVLIFLYGDGANGKSVFMEVLSRVLAAYAGRLKPESITGAMEQSGDKATPDFARLQGKRFVAIAELPRGAPLREGLVKTMTGSEPMPVRHLNHGFFDLLPEFIPFMSGNQMPEIGGLDRGIWRRLKFVLWPVTIPDEEQKPLPEVVEDMLTESSGILNWLVEGALLFLTEGLIDPPDVKALGEEHRSDLDPVGNFVRDCVKGRAGAQVQARVMYQAFENYCLANSIRPWKEKSFSLAMKQKGFVRRDGRIRFYLDCDVEGVPDRPDTPHGGFPEGYGG